MAISISIIMFSILLSSTAHIFLKKGMLTQQLKGDGGGIFQIFCVIFTNGWILAGLIMHVAALAVWLWALARVDISFAYPFLALGYIFVALMAVFWLGEQLSYARVVGMALVVVGLVIMARFDAGV